VQDNNVVRLQNERRLRKQRQQEKLARLKGVSSSSSNSSNSSNSSTTSTNNNSNSSTHTTTTTNNGGSAQALPSNPVAAPPVQKKRKRGSSRNITPTDKARWLITVREVMSKPEFKQFKQLLMQLSALQKVLAERARTNGGGGGGGGGPTEQEKRDSDDVLRGLVRMMACGDKEKKHVCILGEWGLARFEKVFLF